MVPANKKLPLAIEIEINSDCNLSCSYCPNAKNSRVEKGQMTKEVFELLMKQLNKYSYSGRISYHFYGEPLLSPNLNEFIALTKFYLPNAKAVLFSNGTLLNDDKIQQLQKSGLDQLIITEQHQAPLTHLSHIKRDGPKTLDNKVHLSSFKNLQFTNRGGLVKVGSKIENSLNLPCYIPFSAMVITLSGLVVACYEDYFQKHIMGDIKKSDILDIWHSEKYTYFRNELKAGHRHLFEVCKTCNNKNILL